MKGDTLARSLVAALSLGAALAGANFARAGDLEDGLAAYSRADYAASLRLWKPLAEQGNADAQNDLGLLYFYGQGVQKNYTDALKWFEASARQGKADAQNNLGGIFYNGLGVVQNYAEALKWWQLSAQQGNASAQTAIGDMYRDGLGTPKNDEEAFKWFQLSAQQGDSGAQNNLGVMYHEGRGVAKNDTEALRLLELSARQGNPVGQYDLEMFRSNGYIGANGYVAEIPLEKEGGTLVVPVLINNSIALKFIIDSGSADVSIPADVFLTLMRTGTIQDDDFLGQQTYRLADGSTVPSQTFRIRTLKVGNREIHDITGSIANVEGSLLLGQSFLARFESWSIDNQRQVLVLESGAPIK